MLVFELKAIEVLAEEKLNAWTLYRIAVMENKALQGIEGMKRS